MNPCENCQALLRSNADLVDGQLDAVEALLTFGAKEERLAFLEKHVRELAAEWRASGMGCADAHDEQVAQAYFACADELEQLAMPEADHG